MGQILNRIINIAKSNRTDKNSVESFFVEEDDELKKIIDELDNSENNRYNNSSKDKKKAKGEGITIENAYKILKTDKNSSKKEIKKAYIERIKEYHPDRLENFGEDLKELAMKKTQEINQAYSLIMSRK